MTVGVLTTCHTQYTWDRSMCISLFNRTTLQVFVTYLTGALYVHPLWLYKHQHDNRVRSTRNAFSLLFAAILVNCAPSGEMHNCCTLHITKENSENFLIHRCNYILLSQVYCVWQVVKTPTIILNNPVHVAWFARPVLIHLIILRSTNCKTPQHLRRLLRRLVTTFLLYPYSPLGTLFFFTLDILQLSYRILLS